MIAIDKPKALELLDRAVAEKGEDYIYPGWEAQCSYEQSGRPSCLVGYVLVYAGASLEELELWDREVESLSQHDGPDDMPSTGVELDQDAFNLLSKAQYEQDRGRPWGEAVRTAKAELEAQ